MLTIAGLPEQLGRTVVIDPTLCEVSAKDRRSAETLTASPQLMAIESRAYF
jgi:hypothetical protein